MQGVDPSDVPHLDGANRAGGLLSPDSARSLVRVLLYLATLRPVLYVKGTLTQRLQGGESPSRDSYPEQSLWGADVLARQRTLRGPAQAAMATLGRRVNPPESSRSFSSKVPSCEAS